MRAYGENDTESGNEALAESLALPTTGPTNLLASVIPFAVPGEKE